MRLTLLGVGAMNSPRHAPAGVLVATRRHRVPPFGRIGRDGQVFSL